MIETIIWLDGLCKQALKGKTRRKGKISLMLFWWLNVSNMWGQLLTNSLQGTESRQPSGWTSKKSFLSQTVRWNDRPRRVKRPRNRWKEGRIRGEGGKKDGRERSHRPLSSRQGRRKQLLCMKLPETRTNNLLFKMRLLVKNNIPHKNQGKGTGYSECWLKYSILSQIWVWILPSLLLNVCRRTEGLKLPGICSLLPSP